MRKLKRIICAILLLATMISVLPATYAEAAISTSTFTEKVDAFLADSRWKHGISWGDSQKPKLSSWSSTGCCAYAADFVAYVYGSKSAAWTSSDFTKYTKLDEIRAGDIIHITGHWFVVLERNGNTLRTAEGNFDNKTRVTSSGWGIKNGKLHNLLATDSERNFEYGYHYKFSDATVTVTDPFVENPDNMSVGTTDATISLRLNKASGTKLTAYGATLYDANGNKLASTKSTPSSSYSSNTYVNMWYGVNKTLGVTLTPSTKYQFEFWATVDGTTYTSKKHSFTTKAAPTGTSSTQVYYPIDFSADVLKSEIVSVNDKDCALVSIATAEAYLYGVTSAADKEKVYNRMLNINLGSTSGKPNPLGVESWANLGYNKKSYSLQNLYDQLSTGYPVLIHKTNGSSQHWSVVCGYTGSTAKLEKSGFIVVDIEPNLGKSTLDKWQGSYTLDEIAYRKNGFTVTNLSDGVRMGINVPKVVHPTGNGHGVYGHVVSNNNLSTVQIRIINAKNGNLIYDKTVSPNAKSYQVFKQDSNIKFAELPKGEYYYTVYAKDSAGNTNTVVRYFIVDSKWPVSQPVEPTYTVQFDGNGGTGSAIPVTLKFLDGSFTLPKNPYLRLGYKFLGWSVQRTPDNRWYVQEVQTWKTEAEMKAAGYDARIYEEGYTTNIGWPWIKNCGYLSPTFTFYARWEKLCPNGHSFVNGTCSVCGEIDPDYWVPAPEENTVTRVFGDDRYATSFKAADTLKEQLGISKFQNIVVASGTGFADALAGSYLAAVKNAPILLVKGANVNAVKDYIKANLASGGTVYLLGGVNAVPKTMESGLDGYNVKRLGGADRYETNLLILKEAGVGNKDIIVCTGLNFADSLSASASGLPILLVKGGLTNTQKNFLASTSGKKIIVGGTSAVSAPVEKQLASYGSVKRLAGATRYDTSVLVAKEFFSAPKAAVLAYAQNFPDGLSGGPLAYTLKAPLILTDNKKPAPAVAYATGLGIKSGYVLGGTGLISDKVAKNIFSMTSGDSILVK